MGQCENSHDIGDIRDIGDRKFLLWQKSLSQEGLEERIDLDSVGVFKTHRIDESLLDVPVNGTGGNMK